MPNPLAIDAHAHICTEETMRLLASETPKDRAQARGIEKDVFEWTVAGVPYRPLPRGGFDIEQRLKDMKASDVDMQVLSNTPQTFLYNQDVGLTTAASIIQNDQIAKHVRDYPKSFHGIATLPMQAPEKAADELARAMDKLKLKGAQIASNIMEKTWTIRRSSRSGRRRTALGLHDGAPEQRRGRRPARSYYLNNLIGNPLDTTIAAACLVFGGVIERYPNIRFFMVHGGGFTPYQAGRWQHGWHVRPEPKITSRSRPPKRSARSISTPSCTASPRWSSWCRHSAPTTSCSAATIPTTWARSNAPGRSRRCRSPTPTRRRS